MPPTQLQKKLVRPGNGQDFPKTGDEVTIEYTGWLYDGSKADNDYKGKQFDSSRGRGDFKTPIRVGRVIPGTSADPLTHIPGARLALVWESWANMPFHAVYLEKLKIASNESGRSEC
ncbi:uncharacterized protein PV06_01450 [Exophiala oligosperma]|uniref:peptidylprolyl isomerase n=1 Tax=Exophiala oligosperma TaxID=215243 RepID=A0A0D2B9K8_9EURO|nr:uncharacterized protein PV06_01450 [Exophiala oligosperma]KIW48891.1 hypothetical protein PV06_01450 [Exophiala oligosperma]